MIKKLFLFSYIFSLFFTVSLFAQNETDIEKEFNSTLDKLDIAIEEFVNGEHENFKALWSHSEDITIAGGFGGPIEKGWTAIEKRLNRVGNAYAKTEFKPERIYSKASGDLGYLIQHEYFTVYNEDNSIKTKRAYRITMIFKLEPDGWKLVHRHADRSLKWKGLE